MAAPELVKDVAERLSALSKQGQGIEPADIIDAVQSIMTSLNSGAASVNLQIYAEIEELSRYINAAKAEIAELRPDEIKSEHLPTATDELSQIVGATEQATNSIFEAVESIESLAEKLPDNLSEEVTNHVTAIYEACGFQDITGQRISKVVTALQQIDSKISALVEAFGDDIKPNGASKPKKPEDPKRIDEHLLNGPAKEGEGISQDDIDALMGFD